MAVLWQGHEAEAYILGDATNVEDSGVADSGYERTGMRVGRTSGSLTSAPDWGAVDEIWHRFVHASSGGYSVNMVIWAAKNSSGQIVAQIIVPTTTTAKYQVWNGAAFVDVGSAWSLLGADTKARFDIHHRGGSTGIVEVYYGAPGSRSLVVGVSGSYTSAVSIVRVFHAPNTVGGFFNTVVAHEVVQTTSTLNATSEVKQPTSEGTDVGGTGAYTDVNESTFSDANLINFSAAAQRHSFKAGARTLTQAIVTGVTASCRAWYEAGGPTQIKPYLMIGGTRYYGTTFTLTLTAAAYQYTWTTNPSTGVAFTPAEANSATLEWGWEAV
jgi:hypothetical protein